MQDQHVSKYQGQLTPQVLKQTNGKYTVVGVPIFECHDREDIHCDDRWMYECVADQRKKRADGFLPRLIIGHNPDSQEADEKPVAAFLDNYRYDPQDKWLYADYVDVQPELMADLKANKYPGRSVEASRTSPAIDVVALLGGTPPYFKMPDLKFSDNNKKAYLFSEFIMPKRTRYEDEQVPKKDDPPKKSDNSNMEEDADYKKFCSYMKKYEDEKKEQEENPEDRENDRDYEDAETDDERIGQSTPTKPEDEKEEDEKFSAQPGQLDEAEPNERAAAFARMRDSGELKEKKSKRSDNSPRSKYSASQTISYADYHRLLNRVDELTSKNNSLLERNERSDWTQKYSQQQIPYGRLKISDEVDFIMSLPNSKRKAYFDRSIRNLASPATEFVDISESIGGGPMEKGSQREADEIRKYYQENVEKYRGDYGRAIRDYRETRK